MRPLSTLLSALFLFFSLHVNADSTPPKDPEQYKAWAQQLWQSMNRQQGEVHLPDGIATLKVPSDFYYLDAKDAEKILVDVWEIRPADMCSAC